MTSLLFKKMNAWMFLLFLNAQSVFMYNDEAFDLELITNFECSGQNLQSREACPEGYANETLCISKNCCWDDTFEEGFHCFRRRDLLKNQRCDARYSDRFSCTKETMSGSYQAVSEFDCISRGCCYDESVSYNYLVMKALHEYQKAHHSYMDSYTMDKIRLDVMIYLDQNPIPQCFLKKELFEGRCIVPNNERKPCGSRFGNITFEECIHYNCCYSKNIDNEINCFHKDFRYDTNVECRLDHKSSVQQYDFQNDEIGCLAAGYCFLPPNFCYLGVTQLAEHEKQLEIERANVLKGTPITESDVYLPAYSNPTTFCWSSSYGRGIGHIPSDCAKLEKQGLLCYPKCKSGYRGVLFVCWQDCPDGFRDDGAFCFKPAPYGRGFGYPWKFGDALNDDGMYSRCMRDHPELGCEKWGLVYYPKCKRGYHNVGCCICSPDCKSGQVDIGISCAKKSYVRKTILPNCKSDQEYDTGLCYKKCKYGFKGVGPVCWGTCPASTPVSCGMACAIDLHTCRNNIFGQITSAVDAIATIASTISTAGASLAAKSAAQMSAKMAAKTVLNKVTKSVTKEGLSKAMNLAIKETGKHIAETAVNEVAYEILEVADLDNVLELPDFDPTGIVNVVRYYNHPVCTYN